MNKDQAQRIIKDTFEDKFDKAKFSRFIVELLNLKSSTVSDRGVTFNKNSVPNAYQPFINSFEKIADYKSDEHKFDILVIRLNKETSIERARTMQRNFIAWYLRGDCDGEPKDAALAAFVSPDEKDWRFSLIKMDYSLGEDKGGRARVSEEFTPAKRWSFLVGLNEKSHTAQSQLIEILAKDEINPTLTQLKEAFNVEKVTREFFNKYRELFFWTKETLDEILDKDPKAKSDFETKNINTIDFSKKLLGQIIFLYFLQKKGWFGVARDADWGTGPKNFLWELFEGKHGKYKNFYNDILEPLFYEALRNDRSYDDDYYRLFNCKIPFLNGGLFDPINNYDWVHTDINLPNDLFANEMKTKEGDTRTGILNIFDRYNFTVKEDEPLEKEVAVDPEMLGKVFENLLEVKDRKSKGTYYTPREIVHYMCQQSLINYLATELEEKVIKEDIENLVKHGEHFGENNVKSQENLKDIPESIIQNAILIDKELTDIKVCDPAVGSGAFLVGMMGEIVRARNVLSAYIDNPDRSNYNFKRECIERSLYGVDIDPGAVEVCKLRLWLSLIVDEEDIRNIKPLPNLDYKIMQGNSLIELLSGEFLAGSTDQKSTELVNKLKKSKDELFDITSPFRKEQKRQEIDELIRELFEYNRNLIIDDLRQKIRGIQNQGRLFKDAKLEADDRKRIEEIQDKIEEHQRLQIPGPAEHFEWYINFSEIFQEKSGFDVVIANPPYVSSWNMGKENKNYYLRNYKAATGHYDLYVLFFEKSLSILRKKGLNCFITSNKFLSQNYGRGIREVFLKNKILRIINFDIKIFEATVDACVTIIQKEKTQDNMVLISSINDQMLSYYGNLKTILENDNLYKRLNQKIWYISPEKNLRLNISNEDLALRNKIEKQSILLNKICYIDTGVVVHSSKKNLKKDYFIKQQAEANLKKFLEGKNVFRWRINGNSYLDYQPDLHHRPKMKELFEREKIIMRRVVGESGFFATYDLGEYYIENGVILFTLIGNLADLEYTQIKRYLTKENIKLSDQLNLRYILAIINSRLIKWFFEKFYFDGLHIYPEHIRNFPVKKISKTEQKPFIALVDKILNITKDGDYLQNPAKQAQVKEYEKQIDQMVYKLYDLTPKEIEIIETFSRR